MKFNALKLKNITFNALKSKFNALTLKKMHYAENKENKI